VNTPHSPFAVGKTMETFHPDMSTYVKSCTQTRPRKSKWCRVISWSVVVLSRSSWSVVLLVVVVSHFSLSVSRLGPRGQSSRSVVLRGWCLYSMVAMHTYLLRHMAGENRGQCLDKCTGVGRTRVGGHETRPKPKPNVDHYLVSYLFFFFFFLLLLLLNVYQHINTKINRTKLGKISRQLADSEYAESATLSHKITAAV